MNPIVMKLLACAAIAVSIFFSGAAWKSQSISKEQAQIALTAATERNQAVAQAIVDQTANNQKTVDAINDLNAFQNAVKDAALDRFKSKSEFAQRKIDELQKQGVSRQTLVEVCSGGDLYRFDSIDIGLLNAARSQQAIPAPAGIHEEIGTITETGVEALVKNDLEVVRLYKELAVRHDGLVDYAIKYQREQAGQ